MSAARSTMGATSNPTIALDDIDRIDADERRLVRAAIRANYAAARRALRLWRAFAAEPQSSGRRERECADSVRIYRREISRLRKGGV